MYKKFLSVGITILFILTCLNAVAINQVKSTNDDNYGYIIKVENTQSYTIQNKIINFINDLLDEGDITVYWLNTNLNNFNKGCFIVPFSGDTTTDTKIKNLINQQSALHDEIYEINEPLSNIEVYLLVKPKIAYHAGDAVQTSKYKEVLELYGGFSGGTELTWENIPNMLNNDDFNLFIWPGGTGDIDKLLFDQKAHNSSFENITKFVENGGGYIGSCYGGYEASSGAHFPQEIVDLLDDNDESNLLKFFFQSTSSWPFLSILDCWTFIALPGYGDIQVDIVDAESPVTFGLKDNLDTTYYGGPMFFDLKDDTKTLATIKSKGSNWQWGFPQITQKFPSFNWYNLPLDQWADYAIGKTIWITSEYENGKLVTFGDHPEFGGEKATRILSNAVFYTISKGPMSVDIPLSDLEVHINGPSEAKTSEAISFTGEANGGIQPYTSWSWDFGDGETSNKQNPTHTYTKDDSYTVTLEVKDSNNNIGTATHQINIIKTRPRINSFYQIIEKFRFISNLINLLSMIQN